MENNFIEIARNDLADFIFRYMLENKKKPSIAKKLEYLLEKHWLSNYEMQQIIRSSSADREARKIRENPPVGFKMEQRPKKIEGYNDCLEYHLQAVGENGQISLF